MSNPYKTRTGGATVTIFVPYDCGNNCPFCINKKEYADMTGFSAEAICESIRTMDEITPYCDFVFTGGEPFANLQSLQVMLDAIPTTHKVYINTTLPLLNGVTEDDIVAFAEKNKGKITCINVSRHLVKYVKESGDDLIARMPVPVRINCVLFRDYPKHQLVPYIERIQSLGRPIQFRFDYTDTTPENLYDQEHDMIYQDDTLWDIESSDGYVIDDVTYYGYTYYNHYDGAPSSMEFAFTLRNQTEEVQTVKLVSNSCKCIS